MAIIITQHTGGAFFVQSPNSFNTGMAPYHEFTWYYWYDLFKCYGALLVHNSNKMEIVLKMGKLVRLVKNNI